MRRLSASRLNDFLDCQHKAALWLSNIEPDAETDPTLELVRARGFEHEAQVLKILEAEHGPAISIDDRASLEARIAATNEAIASGARLIYQAAFANDRWVGFPDFLVRTQTEVGVAYRPEDAKLARRAKAEHVIQLNVYARLVEEATGASPSAGLIHVGAGEPEAFDLRQTSHITDRFMGRFERFADEGQRDTRPVRNSACGRCGFQSRCEQEWHDDDSAVFVAGIRGDQLVKLEQAGLGALSALAAANPQSPPPSLSVETFGKLVQQARLQKTGAGGGGHRVETLPPEPGRGFALLPDPQDGDVFFDIEGDPLYPEGLEYLFGLLGPLDTEASEFKAIWAHDHAEEKVAFEDLMDRLERHFNRYPKAKIYHYAPYEVTALKRLAMRYATREAALDQMLRDQRFVDLYKVVRQGLRASTEGYSLKDLEKIYWNGRQGEVTNAGDSIVEYERWREVSDPAILESIRSYNEDDVRSTLRMRDWLVGLRPTGANFGLPSSEEHEQDPERAEKREAFEAKRQALAAQIRAGTVGDARVRDLLAEMLWFHQRAHKPVWWAIFDRQAWTDEEFIEDLESLGALTLKSQVQDKRSYEATYGFPIQETRLKVGATPNIAATLKSAGTIKSLNVDEGLVVLRRGTAQGDFPEACSLSPGAPIDQSILVSGIIAALESLVGDPSALPALVNLLMREAPRMSGRQAGAPIVDPSGDLLDGTIEAVRRLDRSSLIIQGPPGTGKTYTTARAIVALLRDGKRVGVSSNSHKAIINVLEAIQAHADETGFDFRGVKKGTRGDDETAYVSRCVQTVFSSKDVTDDFQLVGGTAYHFAGDEPLAFDYLFVDEAGQVALGNLIAMAPSASNLVLVGDQMQLPQPVQGVHPGESGLSCLDYAMQDHATVATDRGVLLNVSRRMHPEVCGFISDAFYEGRLLAHPSTAQRSLHIGSHCSVGLRPNGISVVEVVHSGCTQSSTEEARTVRELYDDLVRSKFAEGGKERRLQIDDILVVSPYNMQVSLLKRALPPGARVGTVDKFQGQEAPVVIVSMATSLGGEAPRGTEFLFNRNRLNVAISRAQCLAILVRSDRLLETPSLAKDDLPRLDVLARADAASSTRAS